MIEIKNLFAEARKSHRAGDLVTAEGLYRQALMVQPDDPDANHLLGLLYHQQGRNETALELIRKSLDRRPDSPAACNNLGSVLKELGRYEESLAAFEQAVTLLPDSAEANNNLGTVYKKLRRMEEAETALRRAVSLNPRYIKALNNLGNLFHVRREYGEALNWYGRALVLDHDLPLTHYNLGCTLLKVGRLEEAEAALVKALQGQRDMVEALNALGRLYCLRCQYGRAVGIQQRIIALRPGSEKGYVSLGDTLMAMSRYGEAADCLEKARAIAPDSARVFNSLGQAYRFLGRTGDALACLERARELDPDNAGVLGNLAALYMAQGEFAGSAASCREAIRLHPGFAPAYCQLAQLVEDGESDQLAREISGLLENKSVTLPQKMQLNFGLAKLLEDQGKHAQAFTCLEVANRMKRRTFKYRIEHQRRITDRLRAIYNDRTLGRLAGKGYPSRIPVFIVGMPRSGTTLVEQILSSHPDVHGAGELQLVSETLTDYLGLSCPDEFAVPDVSLEASDLIPLGREYVGRLRIFNPDALHIVNKMPGNFMNLGLINLILPQAAIIHCMRDPLDTCLSIYKRLFTHGHQYGYDLEELGQYYLLYVRLMEHWREVMPGRFLDFSYEELVHDQEAQTRALLDFIGLDWHEGCLDFQRTERPVHTASAVQVRRPLTDRSVGLWKRYEQQLEPLLAVLSPLRQGPVS